MYDVTPPKKLAIAYSRKALRRPFEWLLKLDARLKAASMDASEPLIAQIKLAWWRDALSAAPEARPKGEPMLQQLADIESATGPMGLTVPALTLIDAWTALVCSDAEDAGALGDFASKRGEAVFVPYGQWIDAARPDKIFEAGQEWALMDIGQTPPATAAPATLPHPLAILYHSAKLELSGPRRLDGIRLLWHAFLRN